MYRLVVSLLVTFLLTFGGGPGGGGFVDGKSICHKVNKPILGLGPINGTHFMLLDTDLDGYLVERSQFSADGPTLDMTSAHLVQFDDETPSSWSEEELYKGVFFGQSPAANNVSVYLVKTDAISTSIRVLNKTTGSFNCPTAPCSPHQFWQVMDSWVNRNRTVFTSAEPGKFFLLNGSRLLEGDYDLDFFFTDENNFIEFKVTTEKATLLRRNDLDAGFVQDSVLYAVDNSAKKLLVYKLNGPKYFGTNAIGVCKEIPLDQFRVCGRNMNPVNGSNRNVFLGFFIAILIVTLVFCAAIYIYYLRRSRQVASDLFPAGPHCDSTIKLESRTSSVSSSTPRRYY